MKLAFYIAKGTIFDKVIRLVTRSKYSHCELVIDGICYSSSNRDCGIRMKNINLDPKSWQVIDIVADRTTAVEWYIKNIGCKYDWIGAITSVLPIHINVRKRYFCSEAVAHMLNLPNPRSQTPQSIFEYYAK
jgi:hypothetical protein